jgi:hypothetical protein
MKLNLNKKIRHMMIGVKNNLQTTWENHFLKENKMGIE